MGWLVVVKFCNIDFKCMVADDTKKNSVVVCDDTQEAGSV